MYRISREQAEKVARVWETLTVLYGSAFTSQYGTEPPELWTATIANLGEDELSSGFRRLANDGQEFPPNLTKFVAACRPKSAGVRYAGGNPTTPKALALPRPKANEEHRVRCLSRIREALKGKTECESG